MSKQQLNPANINMKFVKPSELNLDIINPASLKGHKVGASLGNAYVGPATSSHQNNNVQNILHNLRTPQNQLIGMNVYQSNNKIGKELPGIGNNHRSSSNNRNVEETQDRSNQEGYAYKKRNASGHRMMPLNNSIAQYNNNLTPSKMNQNSSKAGMI
jgi:hypothetical protein